MPARVPLWGSIGCWTGEELLSVHSTWLPRLSWPWLVQVETSRERQVYMVSMPVVNMANICGRCRGGVWANKPWRVQE